LDWAVAPRMRGTTRRPLAADRRAERPGREETRIYTERTEVRRSYPKKRIAHKCQNLKLNALGYRKPVKSVPNTDRI
jgi:hypothetical protein